MLRSVTIVLLLMTMLPFQAQTAAVQPLSLSCQEKPSIAGSCQPHSALVGGTLHRSVLFFVHFQYNFTSHNFEVNASGVQQGQTASLLLTPHRRTLYLNFTPVASSYRELWSSIDFCPATPDDITGCNIVPVTLDLQSGLTAPAANLRLCLTDLTRGSSSCIDLQFPGVDYARGPNYILILVIVAVGVAAEAAWLFYARRPR